jgi:magnesium-transporting ATPase (P-type)
VLVGFHSSVVRAETKTITSLIMHDSGALKAAHLGIALSDAEASVVAPFTSLDKTITSVTEVLREGRCALASAFASYKYMIM